jgi:hypothetical protein
MGPGGTLEAAIEALSQGLTRFIGVTGHGLGIAATHRCGDSHRRPREACGIHTACIRTIRLCRAGG